jgi:hypothetical protein
MKTELERMGCPGCGSPHKKGRINVQGVRNPVRHDETSPTQESRPLSHNGKNTRVPLLAMQHGRRTSSR